MAVVYICRECGKPCVVITEDETDEPDSCPYCEIGATFTELGVLSDDGKVVKDYNDQTVVTGLNDLW